MREKKHVALLIASLLILFAVIVNNSFAPGKKTDIDDASINEKYDSIEAAMQNADISLKSEDEYQKRITQEIFRTESAEYATVFFLSKKDSQEECLTLARFKIDNNGKKTYQFASRISSKVTVDSKETIDGIELVRLNLNGIDIIKSMGVDPDNKKFMCGQNGTTNIKNLSIDGQAPDGIIPFEVLGKKRFFWYYDDLKTDNTVEKMVITMKP